MIAFPCLLFVLLAGTTHASIWNTGSGDWSVSGNWTAGVPDAVGAVADLTGTIPNTSVITIDTTPRTVGTLLFGSSTSNAAITLAASGGGTLTFDNGASDAELTMPNPARGINISAPLIVGSGKVLRVNLDSTYSGGAVNFQGGLSGGGTIIFEGTGTTPANMLSTANGVTLRQESATSYLYLGAAPQNSLAGLEIISGTVYSRNTSNATDGITLGGGKFSVNRDTTLNATTSTVTVTQNSVLESGRHSTAGAGVVQNMAGLSIGNQTLTVQPMATNAGGQVAPGGGTAGFNFTGTTTLTGTNATFEVVDNDSTGTAASLRLGAINQTGTSGLTKTGSGTLILAGAASYSGTTAVNAGTLLVSTGGSPGSTSGISVATGATVENANGAAITRPLSLQEGAAVITSAAGSSFSSTNLTLSGDLSDGWTAISLTSTDGNGLMKGGALTLTLSNITAGTYNLTSGSAFSDAFSSMNINGNALTANGSDWEGAFGGFDFFYTNSTNVLSVIPEPSVGLLFSVGLTALLLRRRRAQG